MTYHKLDTTKGSIQENYYVVWGPLALLSFSAAMTSHDHKTECSDGWKYGNETETT